MLGGGSGELTITLGLCRHRTKERRDSRVRFKLGMHVTKEGFERAEVEVKVEVVASARLVGCKLCCAGHITY